MSDNVNHPSHYTTGFESSPLECIDITRHMPFVLGNAFKYVWRAGKKGGKYKAIEDLQKAQWYIQEWLGMLGSGTPRRILAPGAVTAWAVFSTIKSPGDGFECLRYVTLKSMLKTPFKGKEAEIYLLEDYIASLIAEVSREDKD